MPTYSTGPPLKRPGLLVKLQANAGLWMLNPCTRRTSAPVVGRCDRRETLDRAYAEYAEPGQHWEDIQRSGAIVCRIRARSAVAFVHQEPIGMILAVGDELAKGDSPWTSYWRSTFCQRRAYRHHSAGLGVPRVSPE